MIALLVVTRNEAPLLRLNVEHHLGSGIDHVAVADNESTDETQEVARAFGSSVSTVTFGDITQRLPVLTDAFHRAEALHGPISWAGVSDTDEFWWTARGAVGDILADAPTDVVGVNFEQKLFLPTELDPSEGPIYCRRRFRTTGPGSPLHTSYKEGKSFYRGSWLRSHGVSGAHWCQEIPHPPWHHEEPLVYHYMIDDEDSFVTKVRLLESWRPQIRDERIPLRLGEFKRDWWQLYQERGEEGLREYYRDTYLTARKDVAGCLERGELVRDTAFADFKHDQLRRTG